MTAACIDCAAWRPWGTQRVLRGDVLGTEPVGQCRARPPSIDTETASTANAVWPVVAGDDWCAEFRPSRQNPVARSCAAPSSSRHEGRAE